MNYFVYVIYNDDACRRYVGHTENLERRLAEHNGAGESPHRYTAKFPGMWRLLHSEQFASRSEAMRREKWLKTGIGRQWLDANVGRASPPKAD